MSSLEEEGDQTDGKRNSDDARRVHDEDDEESAGSSGGTTTMVTNNTTTRTATTTGRRRRYSDGGEQGGRKKEKEEGNHHDQDRPRRQQQRRTIGLRDRVKHFTWANFAGTQSTGGVAVLLSECPRQFPGQRTAGTVLFVLNLATVLLFAGCMAARALLHPRHFRRSLTRGPEAAFSGSFWLTLATVIMGTQRFGVVGSGDDGGGGGPTGPWLVVAVRVLFWTYAGCTLLHTTLIFIGAFASATSSASGASEATLPASSPSAPQLPSPPIVRPLQLNPAAFLMVFNSMLTGTVAATISASQPLSPVNHRLPILVAGVAFQGLGWLASLLLLPWYLGTLLQGGAPPASLRPGMWLPVGASGYTIVALVGCSRALPRGGDGGGYFAAHPQAAEVLRVLADWVGVFMWLFTFWLFLLALVCNLAVMVPSLYRSRDNKDGGTNRNGSGKMSFTLSWWAMVFPNVGFVLATGMLGQQLGSDAVQWVAAAMTAVLFAVWLLVAALHARAVIRGLIMWPGCDEDAPLLCDWEKEKS